MTWVLLSFSMRGHTPTSLTSRPGYHCRPIAMPQSAGRSGTLTPSGKAWTFPLSPLGRSLAATFFPPWFSGLISN